MERIKGFLSRRKIMVFLLVLLSASIASNLYLYLGVIKPLQEKTGILIGVPKTPATIHTTIQGGMGRMTILIWERLMGHQEFDISIGVKLWAPLAGSKNYSFSFKIYRRALDGEYPEAPTVEKTVVVHKDKDSMYVSAASGMLTLTVPPTSTPKIYIYKVGFGIQYYIEFAITTEVSGPSLP